MKLTVCWPADCMLDLVDADAEDAVSFTSAASADSPKGYGHANGAGGQTWERVRAAIRYVTQKPWNRIPPITRTLIYNPVLACLAGGRNKARRSRPCQPLYLLVSEVHHCCSQPHPGLNTWVMCM